MTTGPQAAFTPVIEPQTRQWLDELAAAGASGPPEYEQSPADARQGFRDIQESVPVQLQPADIDDRVIPGGPTGQVSIRIVRPAGAAGVLPVVLHCHGGGWVLGDKDAHERLDRVRRPRRTCGPAPPRRPAAPPAARRRAAARPWRCAVGRGRRYPGRSPRSCR